MRLARGAAHPARLDKLEKIISPNGMSIIGAGKLHPKLDRNDETGKTLFYPRLTAINTAEGFIFVNVDWPITPGFVLPNPNGRREDLWLNSTLLTNTGSKKKMVVRHETGHISDHTLFDHNNPAGGDHVNNSECLMYFSVTQETKFCRDGLLHLRGWSNLHLVPSYPEPMSPP